MLRAYVLIFPTPTTPSVGGVLRGDGGIDFLFSSWGKVHVSYGEKKRKKVFLFSVFLASLFFPSFFFE